MTTTPPVESDIDIIDPQGLPVLTLTNGTRVTVQRIKMRQLMRFLRIITAGGISFPSQDDPDFAENLLGQLLVSLPEAENEAILFVASLVMPADYVEGRRVSKDQKEINQELLDDLDDYFFNPDLDDVIAVLEVVVATEWPHLKSLGKRVQALLPQEQKAATKRAKSSSSTSRNSTRATA